MNQLWSTPDLFIIADVTINANVVSHVQCVWIISIIFVKRSVELKQMRCLSNVSLKSFSFDANTFWWDIHRKWISILQRLNNNVSVEMSIFVNLNTPRHWIYASVVAFVYCWWRFNIALKLCHMECVNKIQSMVLPTVLITIYKFSFHKISLSLSRKHTHTCGYGFKIPQMLWIAKG